MAFTDESGIVMPVSPFGGYGNGFAGDGSMWIIILFILIFGMGGAFGGGYGAPGAAFVDNSTQRGFDQAAVMNGITGVGNSVISGFGDTATNLCGGFAGITAAINNGFAQSEIAANARALSDMQQMFAIQTQLAQCCCDNKAAVADLKYTIANEGCADRAAVSEAVQSVLTQMCNDKIDSKNERIDDLERDLAMASLAASQAAQTAEIISKLPASTTA